MTSTYMAGRIARFCRERAGTYGNLRRQSLTAVALDRAADAIDDLILQIDGPPDTKSEAEVGRQVLP